MVYIGRQNCLCKQMIGEQVYIGRGDSQCRQMFYVGRGEGLLREERWSI